MTTDLTTLLAEADAVSAAATPGPWVIFHCDGISAVMPAMREGDVCDNIRNDADAAFIAASRDLIPRLVAACREQMAEIERLRKALDTIATSYRQFSRAALQPAGKDTP